MARNKKAPGHFEKRGRGWRWRVCVGGRYHRFQISTGDRREAEQWARGKYAELDRQEIRRTDGLPVGLKMSDLIGYFERERLPRLAPGTQGAYGDTLKPVRTYFLQQLSNPPLERIRSAHIADYLDWRRRNRLDGKEPLHNRTLAKDRAVLHRLFSIAEEKEWREGNPVTRVKPEESDKREPVILSSEQYEALIAGCRSDMVRLYVLFNGEAGTRCESEALWLRWEDVDLEKGFVAIVSGRAGHRTKGGRSRHVPLTPRLRAALREHFARYRFAAYDGERPECVFHHTETRRHYKAGQRVRSFRAAVSNAARRAKVASGWHLHDLRHRRVTTWLAEGKSAVLVMKAMGHSDIRTTLGYYRFLPEHLRSLVEIELDTAPATHATGGN
ncbi:site-specific integrase [soil metagenome]